MLGHFTITRGAPAGARLATWAVGIGLLGFGAPGVPGVPSAIEGAAAKACDTATATGSPDGLGVAFNRAGADGIVPSLAGEPDDPIDLGIGKHEAAIVAPTSIPVWFHVITDGPGTDITDEQLAQQLVVFNDSFGGRTGGAASPFSFTHGGTTRTEAPGWSGSEFEAGSAVEREAKAALRVGDATTLNVYITATHDVPGVGASWATFPWWYRWNPSYDGIVVDRSNIVGGIEAGYNLGDIGVHEVGHWMGLHHTFNGYDFETQAGGGCAGEGDYVADTPAEDVPSDGCAILRDSCPAPGTDPVHNFMDYSSDVCAYEFTAGQVERMGQQWSTYRAAKTTKPGKGNGRKA